LPILYNSKRDAKRALLWHLCVSSIKSSPHLWITHLFGKQEWKGASFAGGAQSYIILSSQQTSHQLSDGCEFGVMTMVGDSVWIKVTGSTRYPSNRIIQITQKDPYQENTAVIRTRLRIQKTKEIEKSLGEIISGDIIDLPDQQNPMSNFCATAEVTANAGPHPALFLLDPDISVVVKVWETEPFGRNANLDTLTKKQATLLLQWKPFWSDVLTTWLAYITLRKAGGYDRYWLPPGITSPPIRSRKELVSFLEYSKELLPLIDNTVVYKQWVVKNKRC
jgi:hypothetical protein